LEENDTLNEPSTTLYTKVSVNSF